MGEFVDKGEGKGREGEGEGEKEGREGVGGVLVALRGKYRG